MKTALLLIDIQNDYFPSGAFPLTDPEPAARHAAEVLAHFRLEGHPVIHIQHTVPAGKGTFFIEGTEGADIHPLVAPVKGEPVLIKHAPNSFFETGLLELLKKEDIQALVVCGMMSQMCVDTTVRAARDHHIAVTLIHDACAAPALTWQGKTIPAETVHAAFMAAIDKSFANVVSADEYLGK